MTSGSASGAVNDTDLSPVDPSGSGALDPEVLKAELDIILGFVLGSMGILVVAKLLCLPLLSSNSGGLTRSAAKILDDIFVPASAMLLVPSVQ